MPGVSASRLVRTVASVLSAAFLVLAPALGSQQREGVDFDRARAIHQKSLRGEPITKDERAYLERAKAAFKKKQAGAAEGGQPVPRGSVGLVPISDMKPDDRYKDQDGGLYGAGRNTPPEAHLALALDAARQVGPLDAEGRPDPAAGKVVLVSIGMSNTTQEFRRFAELARRDPALAPKLVIVDGAQGGRVASDWASPAEGVAAGRPDPWNVLADRLRLAGVSPRQVQAAWIKQARANPAALGAFPTHAETLRDNLAAIVHQIHGRFPSLRLAYLSSRTYAGRATTPLNPEPYAYESAFSVRWLVQDQIAGKPGLNADPKRGAVESPVLLWGPYLWTDGSHARADGLTWNAGDLAPDGTHPSQSGQQKVAVLLLRFFKEDPTCRGWFLAPGGAAGGRPAVPSKDDRKAAPSPNSPTRRADG